MKKPSDGHHDPAGAGRLAGRAVRPRRHRRGDVFFPSRSDTTGYQPSAVTITPQQAWDAAGKTLSLSATARDSQAGAVTTAQSFTWALLSSDGSQQLAGGAMTWSAG